MDPHRGSLSGQREPHGGWVTIVMDRFLALSTARQLLVATALFLACAAGLLVMAGAGATLPGGHNQFGPCNTTPGCGSKGPGLPNGDR
jgi:hypothetical protein